MSDALIALTKITVLGAKRGETPPKDFPEGELGYNVNLLEQIVEVAGDAIEEHIVAREGATPKGTKERVFKSIVEQVAHIVDDSDLSDHANAAYTVELIQELLENYKVAA